MLPFYVFTLLVVSTIFLAAYYVHSKTMKRPIKNYPPGPPRWPVFGNILSLVRSRSFQDCFRAWSRKYGKIYSVKIGQLDYVMMVDHRVAKEVLSKEEAAGRPSFFIIAFYTHFKNVGVIFSEGQPWKENRRFILRHLRDLGFGKTSLETLILDELKELVAVIWPHEQERKPFRDVRLDSSLNASVTNVIWWLMACKRVTSADQDFQKLLELIQSLVDYNAAAFFSFFPSLVPYVPGWVYGRAKMEKRRRHLWTYMKAIVEEHRQTLAHDEPRDLIDCYLIEMDRRTINSNNGTSDESFNADMLLASLMDLFIAGAETTSTTLRWFFLYMTLYPEVQAKVQQEIDEVVGKDRQPSWNDKPSMPYTDAVTNEIWRIVTIVPDGVDHKLLADMRIGGYNVPKGTMVCCNLHLIHHDPELWEEPEKFKPERFIGPDGSLVKHEALMPFEVGKRQCLGESLARMNTFLGVTLLLQLFTFEKVPGEDYSVEPLKDSQLIHQPRPYHVRIRSRFQTDNTV